MGSDCIRIGLVGVAHRAAMAENWDKDSRAKIVAGADTSWAFIDQFRKKYAHNTPTVTNDWRKLVERDDIDIVGVFTPDYLHAEPTIAALDAGKHVYCEKPMAIKTADCDAMLRAWKRSGKHLMVGMNMRYMDAFLAFKEVIDSGQLGEVKAVWVRHFVGFGGFAYFHDYRANADMATGLLLQKASHDIDMIHFLTGRFTKRVVAMGALDYFGGDKPDDLVCEECDEKDTCTDFSTRERKTQCCFRKGIDVEDHSMLLMDLGDVRANYVQCHYATETTRNYLVIGGDGMAELTGNKITVKTQKANNTKARARARFATATYDVGPAKGGHGGADPEICRAFLDLIIDGKQPHVSPEAGRMAVAVGCAATESIRGGNKPMNISPPQV